MKNKILPFFIFGYGFFTIITIYLMFAVPLLTKDPMVFPDETFFANTAYKMTGKEKFSPVAFENHLPIIDQAGTIVHGPIHFLWLAIPIRFFGFNIETIKFATVFLGGLTLCLFLLFLWIIKKDFILASIVTILLACDYNFLRMSRFARPEITVFIMGLCSYFFYYLTFKPSSSVNKFLTETKLFLLTGVFLALGIFTHFFAGSISLIVIISHLLITKGINFFRQKNFFILIAPVFFGSFLWLINILSRWAEFANLFKPKGMIAHRIFPDMFSLLILIVNGDIFIKILFSLYLIIFFLSLFTIREEKPIKTLIILIQLVTLIWVFYGREQWYFCFLTLPAYLGLVFIRPDKLRWIIIILFALTSTYEQLRIIDYYKNYSYNSYAKLIADKIPQNSKIFIKQFVPDPYFYLAKNRQDLKLQYERFEYSDTQGLNNILSEADYVITNFYNLESNNIFKKQAKEDFIIPATDYYPEISIFRMK